METTEDGSGSSVSGNRSLPQWMSHPGVQTRRMTSIPGLQRGDIVEITPGSLPLPEGLTPGFQVRLVGFEAGRLVVEREGREWRLQECQLRDRRRHPRPVLPARGPCTVQRPPHRPLHR